MKSLIVFSHLRWDFVFQRPQHLMMRLAKNYRVFFLEEPCLIEGVPHWKIKRPAENVWVCQPHTNIAAGGFHDEQLSVLRPLLADLVMQHSLTKPDVWFYTPMALPLLSGLDAQIVVYDCMDELASFKNAPRQLLQREHALLKICDLVFTGGPSLYRAKQPRHDAVHCFPSSVERAHFARGADPANEHPEQQQVGRPRLGFFGVIDERLDIALLDRLATSHPEWQIIMVGPVVKIDPATLPQHPNVHYFGARPYAELPRFLAGWDVCLLPFARNDATRFISPTKTLEYMAAGKPIVSTPVTDVAEPYSSVVRIGVDDGFVAACAAALTETCDEQARRVARMRDIVDRTSWDRTAQQMRAVRALAPAYRGFRVLHAAWQRYGLPMVITEVQLACTREEQLRWLLEAWSAAWEARAQGCDVRAVTAWALFGAHNWDSLLVRSSGHYEPGAFDTRAPSPRPTALARLLREIASGSGEHHPCSIGPGWWQRPEAAFYGTETARTRPARPARPRVVPRRAPVLICGAGGSLGQALIAACEQRDLPAVPTRRHELDIGNPSALERTLEELRPWAIINAAGFVRVDEAEQRSLQCFQDNTHAADVLARVAERRDLPLVTYSTDLVFDGEATAPYGERAPTSPLNVYGRSKEAAERKVLRHARTLCIRTAAFFGAWGRRDFLGDALDALRRGERCEALQDVIVSPTYLPDLAHASLDLLIDEFTGLLHLVNGGALSWLEFARRGAMLAGLPAARVHGLSLEQTTALAPRPRFSALTSERLCIMPSLESALERYMQAARGQAQTRPERRALGA
jgi:dTDP-4-dehydrorhamnose reductase